LWYLIEKADTTDEFYVVSDNDKLLAELYCKRNVDRNKRRNEKDKESLRKRHDLLWVEIFMDTYKQTLDPAFCGKKANKVIHILEELEDSGEI
jgi:hypothetical protein